MFSALKTAIRGMVKSILLALVPELYFVLANDPKKVLWSELLNQSIQSNVSETCRLYAPYHLDQTAIGDYTYIARNAWISMTRIGKFCSIGRNLVCGQGRHPTNGISTSPYFYSDRKQNGASISTKNKFLEREWITVGNDVFIGMNVTVLDGVKIGDGAVIGAGAVVSKDIPPYAIAVGCPIRIIGYRFDEKTIERLLKVAWWDRDEQHLKKIEELFFEVEQYLSMMEQG